MKRDEATQQEKYKTFKRAFENINTHRTNGNFLAAYVVGFSVIEDRIRAMFVIWHRDRKKTEPSQKQINGALGAHISKLESEGLLDVDLSEALRSETKNRNTLFHEAMWNLDVFTDETVARVIALVRKLDKARLVAAKKYQN